MGKAKKSDKKNVARKQVDPIANRKQQPKIQQTPETDAIRANKIVPVVKRLASGQAQERAEALLAINDLLRDNVCRFLLLKERIVQKLLEDLVVDPEDDVVVLAWAGLRTVAENEGYDQTVNMYRRDIIGRIQRALEKLVGIVEAAAAGNIPEEGKRKMWLFADSIVGLLKCLSETSDQINEAVTKIEGLIPFLMGLLNDAAHSPLTTKAGVVQCLSSLTDDNDDLINHLLENPSHINLLKKLQTFDSPLIRMCVCAILHNISLGPSEAENGISDALILPTLTDFIKHTSTVDFSSYNPDTASEDDKSGVLAAQIALEVVASIGTALGYEVEDLTEDDLPPTGLEDDVASDSEDEEIPDLSEEHGASDNDMDMNPPPTTIDPSSLPSLLHYLLSTTTPPLITLSTPTPTSYSPLQLRALAALNNIAWTADAISQKNTPFHAPWNRQVQNIWSDVITPVLTANTADIDLAEAITGVAWAVAKHAHGALPLSANQHHSFIALYNAAGSPSLQTKCVGVLGCLALPQDRIEINREIGSFLISLITNAPDTPAEPCIEALNAIYDIYGDGEFAYDDDVFWKGGFNGYLESAVPKVRTMIRRINKQKEPELRGRAEEAGVNLGKFVAYKKKEKAAMEREKEREKERDVKMK